MGSWARAHEHSAKGDSVTPVLAAADPEQFGEPLRGRRPPWSTSASTAWSRFNLLGLPQADVVKTWQQSLNFDAIAVAVDDLAARAQFRTKEVAQHPAVRAAHPDTRHDPRFAQQVGAYLAETRARLRIQ